MPQIVFLTFFLGLVTGQQTVAVDADLTTSTVEMVLDGKSVAKLAGPPFHGTIDLGSDLVPHQLVAIGYDSSGQEIARTSQLLNVPSSTAEVRIVVHKEKEGPASVELRWMHAAHEQPAQALVTLDGTRLAVDKTFHATLPKLDPAKPHVIEATLRFTSGIVAQHEITIAGDAYSDAIESQLTPVVVRRAPDAQKLGGCFTSDSQSLHVAAAERATALVVIVKDPDPADALGSLGRENGPVLRWWDTGRTTQPARLAATLRILWPVMTAYDKPDNPTMDVFESSVDVNGHGFGMLWMITRRELAPIGPHEARFFSDAVAVAGMMAAKDGTRRAVVLLLTRAQPDSGRRDPAVTRRYLRSLGVPLHVWSFGAPTAAETAAWGEVEDISTNKKLMTATKLLQDDLLDQTVVWLSTDAFHALHSTVKDGCTAEMVARDR